MQLVKALIGSFALVVLAVASPAGAQSLTHRLKGDVAFTGGIVCVSSSAIITPTSYTPPPGFSANLTPLGNNFVVTLGIQGVQTFNGDGTGRMVARSVSLGNPGPANAADLSGQFAYSVAADRTVTIDQGRFDGVFVAGSRVGQQFRVSAIPPFVGRLSSDGKSLTFATFNPGVEVVTRVVPAPELVESVRICHRTHIGIRVNED
jgi:hypothetical protein